MASRKSWKPGSSKKRSKNKKKKKKKSGRAKEKHQTFLNLPSHLLELIISHLPLKDNIRASAVCKTLHEACVSVLVAENSPWLIYFSKTDGSYDLHDPSNQKTFTLKFPPELSGFRVCYSKAGWLLMYNPNTFQLCFFNPFTHERIQVPSHRMAYDQRMAFSCAPTSASCLVFTVARVASRNITVKTCCPNAKEWSTFVFQNQLPRNYYNFEQFVFSNGIFYCLTDSGCLARFDTSLNSWNVLPGRPPKRPGTTECFMTEHQGVIFLIYIYDHMNPTVLKLDQTSWEWTKMKTLGGLTIYASALSSITRAEQQKLSRTRNCLCLSLCRGFKRTCVRYEVGEDSKICFKWTLYNPYEYIWIMPPLNLLDLPLFDQLLL